MDTIIIIIIALAIQCAVLYFIIKSATQSDKLIEQNRQLIQLTKTLVTTTGGSPVKVFNATHPGPLKVRLPGEVLEHDPIVEVNVAGMESLSYHFSQEIRQAVREAQEANQEFMEMPISVLNKEVSRINY